MRECEILKRNYGPCKKDAREEREGPQLCEKWTKLNNSYRGREGFEKKKVDVRVPKKRLLQNAIID